MLGFNEPDRADQANMTTDDAIALWPLLEQTDIPLVSPVPASAFGGWLADFYNKANARGFRVDYTAVHWYGSPNAGSLISHLAKREGQLRRARGAAHGILRRGLERHLELDRGGQLPVPRRVPLARGGVQLDQALRHLYLQR